jgi:Flp pilus assembly protein TadG
MLKPFILRRFKREDSAMAAVEFALILPVMLTMLFGMGELSLAVFCRTSIGQVASTVSDLIAQKSTLTAADISGVYSAANTLLYPYYPDISTTKPSIRIISVIWNTATSSTTVGKVAWSCTQLGSGTLSPTTRADDSLVTFSQPILASGGSVLMAEVAYSYSSPTMRIITSAIGMNDTFYTKPRRVGQIPKPTCPT